VCVCVWKSVWWCNSFSSTTTGTHVMDGRKLVQACLGSYSTGG